MDNYLTIIISAMLINNVILTKFLGLCPFFGVSKKTSGAFGMSLAVLIIMVLSGAITWILNMYILIPLSLGYMKYVAFILFIASMVQLTEMILSKYFVNLYDLLGIYLPLITTNCAIMGIAIINIMADYSFLYAVANSFGAGLGFMLALLIMSGIRERLEFADIPKPFDGLPIAFIIGAILVVSFGIFVGVI